MSEGCFAVIEGYWSHDESCEWRSIRDPKAGFLVERPFFTPYGQSENFSVSSLYSQLREPRGEDHPCECSETAELTQLKIHVMLTCPRNDTQQLAISFSPSTFWKKDHSILSLVDADNRQREKQGESSCPKCSGQTTPTDIWSIGRDNSSFVPLLWPEVTQSAGERSSRSRKPKSGHRSQVPIIDIETASEIASGQPTDHKSNLRYPTPPPRAPSPPALDTNTTDFNRSGFETAGRPHQSARARGKFRPSRDDHENYSRRHRDKSSFDPLFSTESYPYEETTANTGYASRSGSQPRRHHTSEEPYGEQQHESRNSRAKGYHEDSGRGRARKYSEPAWDGGEDKRHRRHGGRHRSRHGKETDRGGKRTPYREDHNEEAGRTSPDHRHSRARERHTRERRDRSSHRSNGHPAASEPAVDPRSYYGIPTSSSDQSGVQPCDCGDRWCTGLKEPIRYVYSQNGGASIPEQPPYMRGQFDLPRR